MIINYKIYLIILFGLIFFFVPIFFGYNFFVEEDVFTLYDNAIINLEINLNLDKAYLEYGTWRYFTGERAQYNLFFEDASFYCTASTALLDQDSLNLQTQLGSSLFIELPSDTIVNLYSSDQNIVDATILLVATL